MKLQFFDTDTLAFGEDFVIISKAPIDERERKAIRCSTCWQYYYRQPESNTEAEAGSTAAEVCTSEPRETPSKKKAVIRRKRNKKAEGQGVLSESQGLPGIQTENQGSVSTLV